MIDAVFQTSNSFLENPEFPVGIVGFQYSVFGGQGASRFYGTGIFWTLDLATSTL